MSVVTQPAGSICSVPLVEIRITGALDVARLSTTGAVLGAALRLRPACLVVDLAECSGIDAAAINMLLDVHRELSRAGSQLTLRAPTLRLRRILSIARVDHVLHTVPGPPLVGSTNVCRTPATTDVYNGLSESRDDHQTSG